MESVLRLGASNPTVPERRTIPDTAGVATFDGRFDSTLMGAVRGPSNGSRSFVWAPSSIFSNQESKPRQADPCVACVPHAVGQHGPRQSCRPRWRLLSRYGLESQPSVGAVMEKCASCQQQRHGTQLSALLAHLAWEKVRILTQSTRVGVVP